MAERKRNLAAHKAWMDRKRAFNAQWKQTWEKTYSLTNSRVTYYPIKERVS